MTWWVLPNVVIAVVRPVPSRPVRAGHDQTPPRADGVAVEQRQPSPGVHHVAQRGGGHRAQPGVVVQAQLVVVEPLGLAQPHPDRKINLVEPTFAQ